MKEHLKIISEFDQLPLDVIVMSPSHPRGIVQISHGMCEHKERYFDFMNFLCQNGYVCLIHDHRGHGKSIRCDDDLGYFYENGDQGVVEDLHQLTLWIRQRYPQLPLYLFGHSMGSLIVRCYCQKYDQDINGLFVCGSPSHNPLAGVGISLSHVYQKVKNDHYRPQLIQKMSFQAFNKKFNTKIPNSWICSHPDVVKAYNQNPLCCFTFTANGFETLFRLVQRTYQDNGWQIKQPLLPIHFIAGSDDPCIINSDKFHEAVDFMKKCGYQNVTSHLFPHMRHEILNEKDHHLVYNHILKTIKSWQ
ncbi:MAG: alpha/beta fold hydrolase [Longibaculum sp.]